MLDLLLHTQRRTEPSSRHQRAPPDAYLSGEADIFANSDALRSLPGEERVAFVQHFVDVVRDTAKEHFHGLLVGATAWQYYPTDHPLWSSAHMEEVSWEGFDILSSTMLPVNFNHCSVEFAEAYFEAQIAQIIEIAERDHVDWMVGELDIFTFGALADYIPERGCVEDKRAVFLPIWDVALSALQSAEPQPRVVELLAGPAEWAADQELEKSLAAKFAAFSDALQ